MNTCMDPVTATTRRFQQTLAVQQHRTSAPRPVQLARAAAVLPVGGVGLLLHDPPDQWTPLAASNETATLVACLQHAVDDEPYQVAAQTRRPVIATHELLLQQTPVRSILVMPLSGRLHGRGFVLFCSVAPDGITTLPLIQVCTVTDLLSHKLEAADDAAPWLQATMSTRSASRHPRRS